MGGLRITKEEKEEIYKLYDEGKTIKEISVITGRRCPSVSYIVHETRDKDENKMNLDAKAKQAVDNLFRKEVKAEKAKAEEIEESNILGIIVPGVTRVNKNNGLSVALAKDRHDYGRELMAIFDQEVGPDLLFDFDKQYKICKEFLEKNYIANNIKGPLTVYVSGLQSILGSITKACIDMNIDLIFMHWDKDISNYREQLIISGNCEKKDMTYDMASVFNSTVEVYHAKSLTLQKNFMYHTITLVKDNTNLNHIVFYDNPNDAWAMYRKVIDQAPFTKQKVIMKLGTCTITSKLDFNVICTGFNFEKSESDRRRFTNR